MIGDQFNPNFFRGLVPQIAPRPVMMGRQQFVSDGGDSGMSAVNPQAIRQNWWGNDRASAGTADATPAVAPAHDYTLSQHSWSGVAHDAAFGEPTDIPRHSVGAAITPTASDAANGEDDGKGAAF